MRRCILATVLVNECLERLAGLCYLEVTLRDVLLLSTTTRYRSQP
jgi:hypothetical protein